MKEATWKKKFDVWVYSVADHGAPYWFVIANAQNLASNRDWFDTVSHNIHVKHVITGWSCLVSTILIYCEKEQNNQVLCIVISDFKFTIRKSITIQLVLYVMVYNQIGFIPISNYNGQHVCQ